MVLEYEQLGTVSTVLVMSILNTLIAYLTSYSKYQLSNGFFDLKAYFKKKKKLSIIIGTLYSSTRMVRHQDGTRALHIWSTDTLLSIHHNVMKYSSILIMQGYETRIQ